MNLCNPCETAGYCLKSGRCIFLNPERPRQSAPVKALPTFDEWYEAKMGQTFEEQWMRQGMLVHYSMQALSVAMREYVTEIASRAHTRISEGR